MLCQQFYCTLGYNNTMIKMSTVSLKKESIWDVPLDKLYPLVMNFYKKEKDRIVLDYEQKIRLLALFKQEKLGPFSTDKDSDTGYFDVVGSHRRKVWKSLGDMNKEQSRQELIKLLDAATPQLKDYVLHQWRDEQRKEEKENCEAQMNEEEKVTEPPPSTPKPVKSVLAPAALWCTPKAAPHFISQIGTSSDHKLEIGPGEAVTIQVPTSIKASAIFWEFVTEKGDIGFGLCYQRASNEGNEVFPVDQLLPVTKRDCSDDLILGSHQYMTQGTYMLQFDNSHCTSSSKIVYYKVFYQTISPN